MGNNPHTPVSVATPIAGWNKLMDTNSTNTAFGTPINQSAVPSTTDGDNGVISLGDDVQPHNHVVIGFFGTGAENTTFSAKLWGWMQWYESEQDIWKPVNLGTFACTLGTGVGVASTPQAAAERDADTITESDVHALAVVDVHSPADNTQGIVVVDRLMFRYLMIDFDMTGATDGNAIWGVF